MLHEYREQKYWQEYVASHLWLAAGAIFAIGGNELKSPPYSEIIHPERKDNRTAQDIKNDLLKKLA